MPACPYRVPLPELLVLGVIFTQIIACIKGFQSNYQLFMEHVHGYRFCMKVIAQAKALEESDSGTVIATFERGCRFDAVSFSFNDTAILDEVSLDIPARSITVLTGPSGPARPPSSICSWDSTSRPRGGSLSMGRPFPRSI